MQVLIKAEHDNFFHFSKKKYFIDKYLLYLYLFRTPTYQIDIYVQVPKHPISFFAFKLKLIIQQMTCIAIYSHLSKFNIFFLVCKLFILNVRVYNKDTKT